jgi:adenine deaminase
MSRIIRMASGEMPAELVLKGASIVNVFTGALERADIAVCGDTIIGVGSYAGETERDLTGKIVCPGFIDGHIHIESTMLLPREFAAIAAANGTTAVVTDPHEVANVCGAKGIAFMLRAAEGLPVDFYCMRPSCVPATALDGSGAALSAADLRPFYGNPMVLGLAEMMDYPAVLKGDAAVLEKLKDAAMRGLPIDGHAPGLGGKGLNAYIAAGVGTDHECTAFEEAVERIGRGQWVMIREGTAARNLEALMGLFAPEYAHRCLLVTDDKHPGDLLRAGHINGIVRKAVSLGADAVTAIRMATFNAAACFGLKGRGAIAPGCKADMAVLDSLQGMNVLETWKNGVLVAENGAAKPFAPPQIEKALLKAVADSFKLGPLGPDDFHIPENGASQRIISLLEGELLTRETVVDYVKRPRNGVDLSRDIIKLAVAERYGGGRIGLGYLQGYGLQRGAVASSVAHDSHNIIVAGTNELDMAVAANAVREQGGGWAIAEGGAPLKCLPLPIAGLMSPLPATDLAQQIGGMKRIAAKLGVNEGIDAFMTLAFLSLPVIPEIKLTARGLVLVSKQELVQAIF